MVLPVTIIVVEKIMNRKIPQFKFIMKVIYIGSKYVMVKYTYNKKKQFVNDNWHTDFQKKLITILYG